MGADRKQMSKLPNFSAYIFEGSLLSVGNLGRGSFFYFLFFIFLKKKLENIDLCKSWNLNEEIFG